MKYIQSFKIFESNHNINNYVNKIKKDCQPFIELCKREFGDKIQVFIEELEMFNYLSNGKIFHDGMEWIVGDGEDGLDEEEVEKSKKYLNLLGQEKVDRMRSEPFWYSPFIFRGAGDLTMGNGGSRTDSEIDFIEKDYSVRKSRTPLDTHIPVRNIIDRYFKSLFGIELRKEGVFTGNYMIAGGYGNPFLFFPIGNFDYYWSDQVKDLYTKLRDEEWYDEIGSTDYYKKRGMKVSDNYVELAEKDIEHLVNTYKKNTGLSIPLTYSNIDVSGTVNSEVIFDNKKHYLLNSIHGHTTTDYLYIIKEVFS